MVFGICCCSEFPENGEDNANPRRTSDTSYFEEEVGAASFGSSPRNGSGKNSTKLANQISPMEGYTPAERRRPDEFGDTMETQPSAQMAFVPSETSNYIELHITTHGQMFRGTESAGLTVMQPAQSKESVQSQEASDASLVTTPNVPTTPFADHMRLPSVSDSASVAVLSPQGHPVSPPVRLAAGATFHSRDTDHRLPRVQLLSPTQSLERTGSDSYQEHTVELKRQGRPLGLSLISRDDETFVVMAVGHGPVEDWNNTGEGHRVTEDQQIVAVNEIVGTIYGVEEMMKEICSKDLLTLRFRVPGPPENPVVGRSASRVPGAARAAAAAAAFGPLSKGRDGGAEVGIWSSGLAEMVRPRTTTRSGY